MLLIIYLLTGALPRTPARRLRGPLYPAPLLAGAPCAPPSCAGSQPHAGPPRVSAPDPGSSLAGAPVPRAALAGAPCAPPSCAGSQPDAGPPPVSASDPLAA